MGKRNRGNKKKEQQKKQTLTEKIINQKEIIMVIIPVLSALYLIFNAVYNIIYRMKCEEFYHLPGKYFHIDVDYKILYLVLSALLIVLCILPGLMKKQEVKKNNFKKGTLIYVCIWSVAMGAVLGLWNILNLLEIVIQTLKINHFFESIGVAVYNKLTSVIVVIFVISVLTVIGFTFMEYIKNIKNNIVRMIIVWLLLIFLVLSFLIVLYGMLFKLGIHMEDKKKYEIISIESTKYAVLSDYEEKLLVVPLEKNSHEQYVFKTKQYRLVKDYDDVFEYIEMQSSPIIDSQ